MTVQLSALIARHGFSHGGRFAVEDGGEAINDCSCGGIFHPCQHDEGAGPAGSNGYTTDRTR